MAMASVPTPDGVHAAPKKKFFSGLSGKATYKSAHAALFEVDEVMRSADFQHTDAALQIDHWVTFKRLIEESESLQRATSNIIGSLSSRAKAQALLTQIQILKNTCERESLRRRAELMIEMLGASLDVNLSNINHPATTPNYVDRYTTQGVVQVVDQRTSIPCFQGLDDLKRYANREIVRLEYIQRSGSNSESETLRDPVPLEAVEPALLNNVQHTTESASGRPSIVGQNDQGGLRLTHYKGKSRQLRIANPSPVYQGFNSDDSSVPVSGGNHLVWDGIHILDGDDPSDETSLHTTSSHYGDVELSQEYTEMRILSGDLPTADGHFVSARPSYVQRDITRTRYQRQGSHSMTTVPEHTEAAT